MKPLIEIRGLRFTYKPEKGEPVDALKGVDLEISEGEYVVVFGHNGSGKSTLARHLNALLIPTEGEVRVNGIDTRDASRLRDLRSTVGMVFQHPDNQIVATIVEEDIAFGPENLGVPRLELLKRVDWALERVNLGAQRLRPPHALSGGQKQRVCIAGVLAMKPRILVLDEATAMLDPIGRREVLDVARRMNKQEGVTVIAITHLMEEAADADRVVVMSEGRVVLSGPPREVFAQADRLRELKVDVPQVTRLAHAVRSKRPDFPADVLTIEEFVARARAAGLAGASAPPEAAPLAGEPVIEMRHVAHDYMRDTPLQVRAIHDITLDVPRGHVIGIIGHTGSGKSTAIQHFNALLRPHEGEARVLGKDTRKPNLDTRDIRRRVGLVFQQPETQLFEHYVGDDIAYGPRNLKLSREEVRARVRAAMERVGLGFEAFKDRITFGLSGGEMRRVAIAGVLALDPEVLVLDEPTSGLDPAGRDQLYQTILALRDHGVTLVLVSHNMEELARACDRIYVIGDGRTMLAGTPAEVFSQEDQLRELALAPPPVTTAMARLGHAGVLTVEEAMQRLEAAQ